MMVRSILSTAMLRLAGSVSETIGHHRVRGFKGATETVRRIVEEGSPSVGGFPMIGGPAPPVSKGRRVLARVLQIALPVSGISCMVYAFTHPDAEPLVPTRLPPQLQYLAAQKSENQEVITNWSGTHAARPKRYFMPESEYDVEYFVRAAHDAGQKLRVVGSAISPNGLGLSEDGMMSMALMDKVISIDKEKMQVTVQAGCRVQQLVDALKPHGLTLQNYASIRDQQIGGFTQVGAHGTGATLPPVDDQVVSMKLATPALGTVTLSHKDEPELFSLAKVGLGALGVVTQVTLQCVPRHLLAEKTFTATLAEVKKNHTKWLQENLHLRYLWIPHTDTVVVVQCNPIGSGAGAAKPLSSAPVASLEQRLKPLRDLFPTKAPVGSKPSSAIVEGQTATDLRDSLLALDPVNKDWVARVNRAEAEYWRLSSGTRVGYSDEILGFDCGGEQLVLETAFQVVESLDKLPSSGSRDIEYMEALMAEIKRAGVPAPSPIEQRWTSGSTSAMSPAAGPPGSLHSWVGIISYLPQDEESRKKVAKMFRSKLAPIVQDKLMPRFNATWHWAKLELQDGDARSAIAVHKRLASRFPIKQFNSYRTLLDPKNVLSNQWLDRVIPKP